MGRIRSPSSRRSTWLSPALPEAAAVQGDGTWRRLAECGLGDMAHTDDLARNTEHPCPLSTSDARWVRPTTVRSASTSTRMVKRKGQATRRLYNPEGHSMS